MGYCSRLFLVRGSFLIEQWKTPWSFLDIFGSSHCDILVQFDPSIMEAAMLKKAMALSFDEAFYSPCHRHPEVLEEDSWAWLRRWFGVCPCGPRK